MGKNKVPRRRRSGLKIFFAMMLSTGALAIAAYVSIAVYAMVRSIVGIGINLPSFESLVVANAPISTPPADILSHPLEQSVVSTPAAAIAGTEPSQSPSPLVPEERINILLLGIDQRPGESGPFRTDTMIVLTIDPRTGTAGMLSIPRDLWVPIPGYGENRINTAHFIGDLRRYPGGGPALAKKTVSYNFGFPVHYYVRLNFEGFRQIIDIIGGIEIDVPKEIHDDKYPDMNYGYEPIHIPAGRIHMDGDLALKYARTRKADSDFHRARRQQQVILAVKDKLLQFNLLPSLLPKLPELTRTLSDSVSTDIPMDEMLRMSRLALSLDMNNIKTVVIDETMTIEHETPNGAQVLLPIREQIRPVVDDLFWKPLPTVSPSG